MAAQEKKRKYGERVSKPRGTYNQYLRKENPFDHIPESSKRMLQSSPIRDGTFHNESVGNELEDIPGDTQNLSATQTGKESEMCAVQHSCADDHFDCDIESFEEYSTANICTNSEHSVGNITCEDNNSFTGEVTFEEQQRLYRYEMAHESVWPENDQFDDAVDSTCTQNDNQSSEADKKIYEGSNISLGASMLLIMSFSLKYSLTGEGLNDLLQLIEMHCPSSNCIPRTLGKFKQWFKDMKHPLKFHKFCSVCKLLLEDSDIQKGVCPTSDCKNLLRICNGVCHFIEIPIREQVKSLMSRPGFFDDLQHRFTRVKQDINAYEDIYDGEVYKGLLLNGFLSNPHNISLLWNTDGIPCFKSSKMSLWPLFFQINELPYRKRTATENLILGGLWFGDCKPAILSFTKPFIDCLQQLESDGVEVSSPEKGTFQCHVAVIGGTADLPARSLACNTMQFNGKYGCCKCLQPGETFKIGSRGHCHVFPFQAENACGPPRTTQGFLSDVETATMTGVHSHGVKGPSFLQCLMYYDLVAGTCIDYMHGVLLGVTKLLMKLWFSTDYAGEEFSISSFTDVVDKRLGDIKPPNNISRCPRSIKEHLSHWKATELRSWLLYYSLPLLKDIHSPDIYQHYILFVESVYLLLQDSISIADVNKAENMLIHFCCMFGAFYGGRFMTCNVHQLLHLPEMVRTMGPLWAYSCFPFENANGMLLKLYNGTQNIDMQIAQSVSIMQRLPELYCGCLESGTPEFKLYESLKGIVGNKKEVHLMTNVYSVGTGKTRKLQQFQVVILTKYLGFIPSNFLTFDRVRIGREVFHSRSYLRCHVRNSYTIMYKTKSGETGFGQVEFYVQIQKDNLNIGGSSSQIRFPCNVAIVSPMENDNSESNKIASDSLTLSCAGHIHVLKQMVQYKVEVVPLDCIIRKCVFIEISEKPGVVFACETANTQEQE